MIKYCDPNVDGESYDTSWISAPMHQFVEKATNDGTVKCFIFSDLRKEKRLTSV